MFTIKKLIVLCAAIVLAGALPSEAKTQTQTANKPNRPNKPGGYGVSTTTGWRSIGGWEKDITNRDPNLQHWNWAAMREMNKAYVRLRPGQRDQRRPSRYVKPVHTSVARPHVAHYMGGGGAPSESRYSRPVSVPLPSRNVAAKLHAPSAKISLSAPRTSAAIAVPSTSVRLAAPETRARLASTNTAIRLSAVPAQRKPQTDAMSDCGSGFTADSFETPDAENSPYGPAVHRNYGYGHKTSANVKAKLVKKRSR